MILKRTSLFIFFILFCAGMFAQNKMTLREMKQKTDSILAEADLLYRFEKAAWIATDSARAKPDLQSKLGTYVLYQVQDMLIVAFINRNVDTCIYEAIFSPYLEAPVKQTITNRALNETEKKLISVMTKAQKPIIDKKYPLSCPEGFKFNMQLIPCDNGYKLYLLTGTTQMNIIPFGNDYLFRTDKEGNILGWRSFHSSLLVQPVTINGQKITRLSHSHLAREPFISATDICTFRLYGSYYGLNEFSVYSPAFSLYFTYKLDSNTIEISTQQVSSTLQ